MFTDGCRIKLLNGVTKTARSS